jgi:hypothetical protein
MMCDELRQSFALLPRRSEPRIWIYKPSESRIKKFSRGRSLPTGALSIEGPTKNKLCRTIMFCSHPSEPMVDERVSCSDAAGQLSDRCRSMIFAVTAPPSCRLTMMLEGLMSRAARASRKKRSCADPSPTYFSPMTYQWGCGLKLCTSRVGGTGNESCFINEF